MKLLLLSVVFLTGCISLEYTDPSTGANLKYSSAFKTAEGVEIVYTSPDKTVGVSIGSTHNDQIFEQIGEIIKSYNVVETIK